MFMSTDVGVGVMELGEVAREEGDGVEVEIWEKHWLLGFVL